MTGWLILGGIILLIIILLSLSVNLKFTYDNGADFRIKYFIFTLYPVKKKKRAGKGGGITLGNKKETKKNDQKVKNDKNINLSKSQNSSKDNNSDNTVKNDKSINAEKPVKKSAKQKDIKKEKIKKTSKKISESTNQKTSENKALKKIDLKLIRLIIESFAHPFGRLFRKIRFNGIYVKSVIRAEDAAEVAINYGFQNAAVSSFLAYLNSIATVNVKKIEIIPDFERYDKTETELYLKCNIKIRLASLVLFVIISLKRFFKNNMKQTQTR